MDIDRHAHASPLDALLALKADLLAHEHRHGMSSDVFIARYQAGELGDKRDLVAWAGDYQLYQSIKREVR